MSEENKNNESMENMMVEHRKDTGDGDMLSSITFALILIWSGIVFLASNFGWFDLLGISVDMSWKFRSFENWNSFGVWNLIALGAGGIILVEALLRLIIPKYRRKVGSALITVAVFIGIGLGGWYSWSYLWPLVLIAIGINMLITGVTRKGR